MKRLLPLAFLLTCALVVHAQIPHLEKRGNVTQMIVDGKPFLMLAGEVSNSAGSNAAYMEKIMKGLKESNLNSVLVSVSWEIIEPTEGVFDFSSVDTLISIARLNKLRLGILWFGAWKNGISPYAPMWVLGDVKRFPRVKNQAGENTRTLTPFSTATREADAKAYTALMQHLAATDNKENTVIVVQIENEVGVLGDTRDFSSDANKAFASDVPKELIQYLVSHKNTLEIEIKTDWGNNGFKTKGSWREVFGDSTNTDLYFMAWNYSSYVNAIAEAGKKAYNIPMYTNAWMPAPRPNPGKPGNYPSGGPIITVLDIWKAGAPALDMQGPDLYGADFKQEAANFHRADNPLFIPETNTTDGPACWAFAQEDAICFSPFGIDNRGGVTANEYAMINELMPIITGYQGTGKMFGIYKERNDSAKGTTIKLNDNITVHINYQQGFRPPVAAQNTGGMPPPEPSYYGIFIKTGENEFMLAGYNLTVSVSTSDPKKETWLKDAWEGSYENGEWKPKALHNGDEAGFLRGNNPTYFIRAYRSFPAEPAIFKFKVLVYDK